MNHIICLKIADFFCLLNIDNLAWYRFLKLKYSSFLVNNDYFKKPPHLTIIIKIVKKNPGVFFDEKARKIHFKWISDLSSYQNLDFNIKTIFGWVLIKNKGFLLHSSSLVKDDKIYLFSGKDGSGKTTIIKSFPEHQTLSNDFSIIKKNRGRFYVFCSPFYEKYKFNRRNVKFPVKALFFIKHAPKNRIKTIDNKEKIRHLLSNIKNVNLSNTKFPSLDNSPNSPIFFRDDCNLLTNLWSTCYNFMNQIPINLLFLQKGRSFWTLINNYEKKGKI